MTDAGLRITRLSLFGFLLVLLLAWFCYRPAMSGVFQLDDVSNLGGLADVEDVASAIEFVLSGGAGPAGRPLALLTFAFQAEHWEEGAEAFLKANILIHLVNAVLLAACLYWLGRAQAVDRSKAVLAATAAASLWVLMPLLATASLHVVQRMTTLSASFVFLGLGAYLLSRASIARNPRLGMAGITLSVLVGTLLATLGKESGLLLPLYILVLEVTVLTRPEAVARRHWRIWQTVFLGVPTAIVLVYLSTRVPYSDGEIARRGFSAGERLLTESKILWLYLQKAVLGVTGQLGLYQTPPAISRSLFEPLALLSTVAWLFLAAMSIAWRRRYPLAALAVLWYLGGHVLESTVLPLELYFEHRNYLPVVGPLYALSAFLAFGPSMRQHVGAVLIPSYILVSAYFLYSFASLTGEPSVASRYWAARYPDSVRAVTTMARYQLSEEGPIRALSTLDRFVIARPQYAYLRLQELNLSCLYLRDRDHEVVIEELRRELPDAEFSYTAGRMLSQLFNTAIAGKCDVINVETVAELARLLWSNPRFAAVPGYNHFHHKLMAAIARQRGDLDTTLSELNKAIAYHDSAELNMMMVTTLGEAGDFARARKFIEDALQKKPLNPLQATIWRRELENLREYIDELERYSADEE